jgi:flagellar motor switch/type III secretory pathway protein FliN
VTAVLRFGEPRVEGGNRRVRAARFVRESNFPLSTACLVANGMRECFAEKLGSAVSADVFAPAALNHEILERLLENAMVFRVETGPTHFWLLLRASSIRGLLSAVFGDVSLTANGALSALELRTLESMVQELARLCAPIHGEVGEIRRTHDYAPMYDALSYFEIRLGLPQSVYLGVVPAHDPGPARGEQFEARHLADVPVGVRAIAGSCILTLEQLSTLEIGDVLPMIRRENARLMAGDVFLAHGTCGSADGRNAFLVGTSGESTTR